MSEVDLKVLHQQRANSLKTFATANFAYMHALKKIVYRLNGMRVSHDAVLLCGMDDRPSNQPYYDAFAQSTVTVIQTSDDIAALPNHQFDVVMINLVFSVDDIESVFAELQQKLREGGVLIFCLLGPLTLSELKRAFGAAHSRHVCSFYDMHDIGDCLLRLGFDAPVMESAPLTVRYREMNQFFQDLRATGCANSLVDRPRTLFGKKTWFRMIERYPVMETGLYPVTLDFVIGHAWRVNKKTVQSNGEVRVSLDQLTRRNRGGEKDQ